MSKVTRIAIGRLHNLGNYEHIRYDVTVEIPEGAHDAGEVIHKLERLLGALAPVKHDYDYLRAKRVVDECAQDPAKAKEMEIGSQLAHYQQTVAKHDAKIERRHAALRAFDNLGGVATFTDAKEKWEDDDDYDY